MKQKLLLIFISALFCSSFLYADGLLMPSDKNYPADFLRSRVTEVSVKITGLVAETIVYHEFINEWDNTVSGVYSFPLPPDARSTALYYMRNDTLFKAVLKVQEQSQNPGTGEGGVAALVNQYIGRNGLKIEFTGIAPGAIQKVELHYISSLEYDHGNYIYKYPLNTADFVKYPLEHLEFNVEVKSAREITDFDIPDFPGYQVLNRGTNELNLRVRKPGAYLNKDFVFTMNAGNEHLSVDFYSAIPKSMSGHFALFLLPPSAPESDSLLNSNILFLLSKASSMSGYKLQQSIAAISQALDMLRPEDNFNVMAYSANSMSFKNSLVPATPENISDAKTFMSSIVIGYGSNLEGALQSALLQYSESTSNNSIVIFTDGRTDLNPKNVERLNTNKVGIFPVGIGDNLDRERMEMTAALNYGFTTYISETDNIKDELVKLLTKISQTLLKHPSVNFSNKIIVDVIPEKLPALFAGSYMFISGRFLSPSVSPLNVLGTGINGEHGYEYQVNFRADTTLRDFPASLWAKSKIDEMEREIMIMGETPELKDSLIAISLKYQIRCRYTSYIADYEDMIAGIEEVVIPDNSLSHIEANYPNPFNPSTTIKFYIDKESSSKIKFLKIFNILGQLVMIIDVSSYSEGWHTVSFMGKDYFGSTLPSGIYVVSMIIDNQIKSSIKINLVK